SAWGGYAISQAAAGAVGSLFLGLSTIAAGWAIVTTKAMPVMLGWVGIVMGAASTTTVLAAHTPLGVLATDAYLPSLILPIAVRIWGGIALWNDKPRAARPDRRSTTAIVDATDR